MVIKHTIICEESCPKGFFYGAKRDGTKCTCIPCSNICKAEAKHYSPNCHDLCPDFAENVEEVSKGLRYIVKPTNSTHLITNAPSTPSTIRFDTSTSEGIVNPAESKPKHHCTYSENTTRGFMALTCILLIALLAILCLAIYKRVKKRKRVNKKKVECNGHKLTYLPVRPAPQEHTDTSLPDANARGNDSNGIRFVGNGLTHHSAATSRSGSMVASIPDSPTISSPSIDHIEQRTTGEKGGVSGGIYMSDQVLQDQREKERSYMTNRQTNTSENEQTTVKAPTKLREGSKNQPHEQEETESVTDLKEVIHRDGTAKSSTEKLRLEDNINHDAEAEERKGTEENIGLDEVSNGTQFSRNISDNAGHSLQDMSVDGAGNIASNAASEIRADRYKERTVLCTVPPTASSITHQEADPNRLTGRSCNPAGQGQAGLGTEARAAKNVPVSRVNRVTSQIPSLAGSDMTENDAFSSTYLGVEETSAAAAATTPMAGQRR